MIPSRMRSKTVSICFVLVLALLGSAAVATASSGAYEFTVRPGSEAWNALEDRDAMIAATQIPEPILATMSTPDLVETVLDYPLMAEVLAFNSVQEGFDAVAARFNGLRELLDRPDAAAALMARYRAQEPGAIQAPWSLLEQGRFAFEIFYVELILAQKSVLARLDEPALEELLFETLVKKEQKLERFDVYGSMGIEQTAFVAARGVEQVEPGRFVKSGFATPELVDFLRDGTFASAPTVDQIFAAAEAIVSGDARGRISKDGREVTKDYYSTVYTPNGSAVTVIVMTYELSASYVAQLNAAADAYHWTATRETNASRRYNCHSYAWYSQSTSNIRWMNTPGDDTYWLDGSYTQVSGMASGRRISYVYGDHSAIAISSSQARSKWGSWPRMKHSPTITPYDSSLLRYYERNLCSTSNPPDMVPELTGNTSAVSTSGIYSSGTEAWRAFDNPSPSSSAWISEVWETPAWIQYNFGTNKRVTKYTITNTNGTLTSRAPKDFQLRGWNGSSWVTVDTRTNQTGWVSGTPRTYTVSSPGYYSQYRLHITDDNDSRSGVVVISIGNLEFRGCD